MRIRTLTLALAAPLIAGVALTGCSSSPASPASAARLVNEQIGVTGAFGQMPSVTFPAAPAGANPVAQRRMSGTGAVISAQSAFLASYVVYAWDGSTHKLVDSSFNSGGPRMFSNVPGLAVLQRALVGQKAGSRILVVAPPKYNGMPSTGDPKLGISAHATLVFVFDIAGVYSQHAIASGTTVSSGGGTLPKVTTPTSAGPTVVIPKTSPPSGLVTQTLIKGTGRPVTKDDFIVVQYIGYDWRTGKSFGSSWTDGTMVASKLDKMIHGWMNGLPGQTVGSRVMLVIPPSQAYGSKGTPDGAIKGGDTLVFVIDIIDALHWPAS